MGGLGLESPSYGEGVRGAAGCARAGKPELREGRWLCCVLVCV